MANPYGHPAVDDPGWDQETPEDQLASASNVIPSIIFTFPISETQL